MACVLEKDLPGSAKREAASREPVLAGKGFTVLCGSCRRKQASIRWAPSSVGAWTLPPPAIGSPKPWVLPYDQVPFVNRRNKVFDLFHVNAAIILKLLACCRNKANIDDWQPYSVAVAAQMFGKHAPCR